MITQERLHALFEYRDGELYWKVSNTNRIKVGDKAGSLQSNGYTQLKVDNKRYRTHRLIFLMHHGYLPQEVDHIDNNPSNNRIDNLRPVTRSENQWNSSSRTDNKSGVKGVRFDKASGKWIASVKRNGKVNHIGYFTDLDVAAESVRVTRLNLHKEYANHG